MVVPIVAGAVLGILWSIVNAVRQIIEWFEKKGFRTIVAHLNTAVKLVDMARSRGMLDQDQSTAYRNVMKHLHAQGYRQKLVAGGQTFLEEEAAKIEREMESRLQPEPGCVMM